MDGIDGSDIPGLLKMAGSGPRDLLLATTWAIVGRLGERGWCVLTGSGESARMVLSTDFAGALDIPIDLGEYPGIAAALARREVVIFPPSDAEATLPGLGRMTVVPLLFGELCLGAIITTSSELRAMQLGDLAAAQLNASLAATFLHIHYGEDLLAYLGCRSDEVVAAEPPDAMRAECHLPADAARALRVPGVTSGGVPEKTRRRILLADDKRDDSEMLAELLEDEGFDTVLACDGAEALAVAKRCVPDLILLDVRMPVMDGFTVAYELAKDSRTCSIPILFVSASEDLLCRVRNLDRDGVDFLRKPFSFLELLARIEKAIKQADSKEHLRLDANLDELTGLGNLRCLREHLEKEQSRVGRNGGSLSIVMIDVDKLKPINDQHGHMAGSQVLKALGATLRSEIRPTDIAVRYGGDEFVVLLPHTTANEAEIFAKRLLSRVNELRPEGIPVSVSIGVAALRASEHRAQDHLSHDGQNGRDGQHGHEDGGQERVLDRAGASAGAAARISSKHPALAPQPGLQTRLNISISGTLARADAAAYRAKRLGGNRVIRHEASGEMSHRGIPTPVPPAPPSGGT